jgi:hypothetical protein
MYERLCFVVIVISMYEQITTKQRRSYIDITMKWFLSQNNRLDKHPNFQVNIF